MHGAYEWVISVSHNTGYILGTFSTSTSTQSEYADLRVVMGPNVCQFSVKFEAICQ